MRRKINSFFAILLCFSVTLCATGCMSHGDSDGTGASQSYTSGSGHSESASNTQKLPNTSIDNVNDSSTDKSTNKSTDKSTDKSTNKATDESTDKATEGSTDKTEPAMTLKVASYNIFHAEKAGYDLSKIAKNITDNGIDIVGFQEVDHFTKRNGNVNQMATLASLAGYPSNGRWFYPAIDHDGGEYGLGIMSRYPILKHDYIELSSGTAEQRILAHAEIDVNGTIVHFFVTHLSYDREGGGSSRAKQFNEIATKLAGYDNFILTGDFNTRDLTEYKVISNSAMVNSKGAVTYPDGNSPLDNIVYSTKAWTFGEPTIVTKSYSDHYMIFAQGTYIKK